MRTEDLIAQLVGQTRPVPRHAAVRRVCVALTAGALVSFLALLVGPGLRPDFVEASRTAPFWMKWVFTLSLVWAGVAVVRRLGDPDGKVRLLWLALAMPFAVVAMMAVGEFLAAPPAERIGLVVGQTAPQCALAIIGLAAPVFVGCLWAFRRLAPTRLRLAGAAAGVTSGAAGAAVYTFRLPRDLCGLHDRLVLNRDHDGHGARSLRWTALSSLVGARNPTALGFAALCDSSSAGVRNRPISTLNGAHPWPGGSDR